LLPILLASRIADARESHQCRVLCTTNREQGSHWNGNDRKSASDRPDGVLNRTSIRSLANVIRSRFRISPGPRTCSISRRISTSRTAVNDNLHCRCGRSRASWCPTSHAQCPLHVPHERDVVRAVAFQTRPDLTIKRKRALLQSMLPVLAALPLNDPKHRNRRNAGSFSSTDSRRRFPEVPFAKAPSA